MTARPGSSLLPGPWAYVLNRAGAPLIPLALSCRVSRLVADVTRLLLPGMSGNVRCNWARILRRDVHDPLVETLTRQCFRHFGKYVAEMIHLQGWDTETLQERLEVRGEEHLDQARSYGKGVIFTSAHMGSTEIAASLVMLHGFKITAVSERLRPQFLMDWVEATRDRMGVSLLPVSGSGLRLLRALRRNEMVAFVIDAGIDRGQAIPVTFFGRRTLFPSGPARLARLSGAPLVFGLAARRPGGRFLAHIEPPLLPDRRLSEEEDAVRLTQALAETFERYVRRYPAQWYVFRNIWPGED